MSDLAEFLARRLDRDEERAKAALAEWDDEGSGYEWQDLPDATFAHARSHSPARVLREVEAKRAILADHGQRNLDSIWCRRCDVGEGPDSDAWYPCLTLRLLAAVYSDHPDYDPAWGHQAEYNSETS